MGINKDHILTFNRGVISALARYRADVKRVGMSAVKQMNFIPRAMGSMSLRPGLKFIGATATADGVVKHIPFIFSNTDTALIEITGEKVRFRVDEQIVVRPAVTTTIVNGNFDVDLTGWTDADQGSATSVWGTGGVMLLTGTGSDGAVRYQEVGVSGANIGVEHALRIEIDYGTIGLRVGSTVDADDYVTETYLGQGKHSIALTPTGNFFVVLFNRSLDTAVVNNCVIEGAGDLNFLTGLLASETLDDIRYAQSGDIIFLARGVTRPPMKIERRGDRSWSLTNYVSDTGPFLPPNLTPVTLVPNGLNGAIQITASQNLFKPTNVGSLYSITSTGQIIQSSLNALDAVSASIKVTGILAARRFAIVISGTWTGTIQLQQSLVEEGNWVDVAGESWAANTTDTYLDGLDNQIAFYRLKMTVFSSGPADVELSIATGSMTGIARMTSYIDEKNMLAIVLEPFGGLVPSANWSEGAWSDRRGHPSAVSFHQGRLYWAGKDKIWGSIVDDFHNFDPDHIGDAGPIDRSIGTGPVDSINWLVSLRILAMGAQGGEYTCRSTSFEEPITPTNFNLREEGTHGSSAVEPVKIDNSAVFMDRTGARVIQLDAQLDGLTASELSVLSPELCLPSIKRIAVQRRPDTRIHFVRCDGTVVLLVYDKAEQVNCFVTVETKGLVEDVVVLPGTPEDAVYYTVARVVNGVVVRYLERWATTLEARGGQVNKMADSFLEYNGPPTTVGTGLDHLEGCSVIVWGNGKDLGTYTVTGGSITISEPVTYAVAGLPYHAEYISGELEYLTAGADSLDTKSRIYEVGLILQHVHKQGILFGSDWDHLDNLPLIENEATVTDTIWSTYHQDPVMLNGDFTQGTRLYLKAVAPRPCTVSAATVHLDNDQ